MIAVMNQASYFFLRCLFFLPLQIHFLNATVK